MYYNEVVGGGGGSDMLFRLGFLLCGISSGILALHLEQIVQTHLSKKRSTLFKVVVATDHSRLRSNSGLSDELPVHHDPGSVVGQLVIVLAG